MSAHEQTCYTCWGTFHTVNPFVTTCPTCQQTKAILKSHERQAEQQAAAMYEAEQQRAAAINHQTNVFQESFITDKEAYDYGFNYIDSVTTEYNPHKVEYEVSEWGKLTWRGVEPYLTDRLNNKFISGVTDRMPSVSSKKVIAAMKESAKRAGRQNAEGTLPSRCYLRTGITIGHHSVSSNVVDTHFSSTIDENTGELKFTWDHPFASNSELNEAYRDGVNEVYFTENTPEKKARRLAEDVPKLKDERSTRRWVKILDKVYKTIVVCVPFIGIYAVWKMTDEIFDALIGGAIVVLLTATLGLVYEAWQNRVRNYL